jgi:hypothetical protein
LAKTHLKLVSPSTINRTVAPRRPSNKDLRTREYLTEAEVERLMKVAKGGYPFALDEACLGFSASIKL